MREHLKRALPVLFLGIIGLAIGVETENIHRHLENQSASTPYTSFCNVNGTVNCDLVIGSRYAEVGGISVSILAVVYYLVLVVLTIRYVTSRSASKRQTLSTLLFASSVAGLAFSFYMAFIALVVINAVCLMCSGLYLVAVGEVVATWRLRRASSLLSRSDASAAAARDRLIMSAAAGAVALLVALIAWEIIVGDSQPTTSHDIDAKFLNWYKSLPLTRVNSEGGNMLGANGGAVTIVEFSDFGCGHCKVFHESLAEVLRGDRQGVRVVFRNFPLSSDCNSSVSSRIHPDSCLAAIAAECAGEQGRFWEYHDLLFDHQEQLGREFLLQYAGRLHLDLSRFGECLASSGARQRVERDAQMGNELNIDSTPTVFINGRTIKGALDAANLRKALILARDEAVAPAN